MRESKFGLSSAQWDILQETVITPLQAHHCKVWIFGSRAHQTHQPFSDIDILFEPTQDLPSSLIGSIQENVENSNLTIKVDLVCRKDVASSYQKRVEEEKVAL